MESIELSPKARVFISCGQRQNEMDIVDAIVKVLENLGFEPYVAVKQHTLDGVKENIFRQLERSEYFLFIDFRRELMWPFWKAGNHRGSLFTNQELALASYFGIDSIGFQQEGGWKRRWNYPVCSIQPD